MKDKNGRLWPGARDRLPKVARFHVPASSLLDVPYDPGVRGIVITETEGDVNGRLAQEFPLYRAALYVGRVLKISQKGEGHEV